MRKLESKIVPKPPVYQLAVELTQAEVNLLRKELSSSENCVPRTVNQFLTEVIGTCDDLLRDLD